MLAKNTMYAGSNAFTSVSNCPHRQEIPPKQFDKQMLIDALSRTECICISSLAVIGSEKNL